MKLMKLSPRAIVIYEVVVGAALVVAGVATAAWWTLAVGVLVLAAGLAAMLGEGESTSWLRGELDERRDKAVDHAFRIAFVVLAWWVAAVAIVASSQTVQPVVWTAGIVVALVAAYIDYARVLRRT